MIDGSLFTLARDFATLLFVVGFYVLALLGTWKQISPYCMPLLKKARDKMLSDRTAAEEAKHAAEHAAMRASYEGHQAQSLDEAHRSEVD